MCSRVRTAALGDSRGETATEIAAHIAGTVEMKVGDTVGVGGVLLILEEGALLLVVDA